MSYWGETAKIIQVWPQKQKMSPHQSEKLTNAHSLTGKTMFLIFSVEKKQMCSIYVDLSVWILCGDNRNAYPRLFKPDPLAFLLKDFWSNIYPQRKKGVWGDADGLKISAAHETDPIPFTALLSALHIFIQSQFIQHYAGLMATVLELILTVSEPLVTYMLNWSSTAVPPQLETPHMEICLRTLGALALVHTVKL